LGEVKPALPFGLLPEGIIVFLLSPTKLSFGRLSRQRSTEQIGKRSVCAGLESLRISIMSTVRLIDDQITALRERPMGGLSPELTHPLKSDKRRGRNMAPSPPRVFISYSHDSAEHKELVLRFAQRLRKDGVDAQIDQFVGGRPTEGWPRWMLDKLDWAEFIILICTETYYRRFRGHEVPGRGRGVDWEGQLITLEIYNAKSHAAKFVPVIFGSKDREFIPEPLSDHVCCLDSEESYQELYGLLTGQAGVPLPELGPAKQILRKDVEPLTFGGQGDKSSSIGRRHELSDRLPPTPTSGMRLTPHANQDAPSKDGGSNEDRRKEIALYALISLISFLCGVVLLILMIWKAELLSRLGLAGNLYYLVLLPMGLAAAGFLFGVLRSYARFSGKQLGGMLELGGPIVAFLLVLILGFVLVKPATTFPFTVYVHGERGAHDLVLKDSGYVYLDLGGYRQKEPIGENGQAIFLGIPPTFRGQEVPIGVEAGAFELSDPKQKCRLDGSSIYLSVQRKAGHLSGRVQDEKDNAIPGAIIHVAGLSATTDSEGHFEFVIPGDRLQTELDLTASAAGYATKHYNAFPNANELVVQLNRTP
jgi:SEFIR domain